MAKVSDLTAITAGAAGDEFHTVDVSDTTDGAGGSSKKITLANLLAVYDSQTATLTNKTFNANGTGNSISNIETEDIASGSKSGSDSTLVTGTAGSNGNLASWDANGDIIDSGAATSDFLQNVVEDTTPQLGGNLDVNGNSITSGSGVDITLNPGGTGNITLGNYTLDGDQSVTSGEDNYVLKYDNGTGLISLEAESGGGGGLSAIVDDTSPQLGGQLDVNGFAIGDGTLELLTFTETGSAVNNLNVTNAATGNGPTLSAVGDDTNVPLNISAKGSGNISVGNFTFDADQSVGAGQDNYVLKYDDGAGTISLEAEQASIANVVEDTSPQLGGQLDVNGNAIGDGTLELLTFTETGSAVNHVDITNAATGNGPTISAAGDDTNVALNLSAKGTGNISIGNFTFDADQSVTASEDNYVLTYDNGTGLISLEAASGGGGTPGGSDDDYQFNDGGSFAGAGLKQLDANTVEHRNSTNGQIFRVYKSFTDASNYQRIAVDAAAGPARITTQNAGTGGNFGMEYFATGAQYGMQLSFGTIKLRTNSTSRVEVDDTGIFSLNGATLGYNGQGWPALYMDEQASDPTSPNAGESAFWQSNGTGTGADGDLIWLSNNGTSSSTHILPHTGAATDYVAISSSNTGGTGSASAGAQYVELNINGTVYKVLHDGTV